MDRFVTGARTGPYGASTSKRKEPDNAWLEHVEIIENTDRNEMCVKCVRYKVALKGMSHARSIQACNLLQAWLGINVS